MKADLARKYLSSSPATPKGRMKRLRLGIRSIHKKETGRERHKRKSKDEPTIIPEEEHDSETHEVNIFSVMLPWRTKKMACCTLIQLAHSQQCLLMSINTIFKPTNKYNTNYIFAIPIKDDTDDSIIDAFDQVFTELKEKGLKPTFSMMNNQVSTSIK